MKIWHVIMIAAVVFTAFYLFKNHKQVTSAVGA